LPCRRHCRSRRLRRSGWGGERGLRAERASNISHRCAGLRGRLETEEEIEGKQTVVGLNWAGRQAVVGRKDWVGLQAVVGLKDWVGKQAVVVLKDWVGKQAVVVLKDWVGKLEVGGLKD